MPTFGSRLRDRIGQLFDSRSRAILCPDKSLQLSKALAKGSMSTIRQDFFRQLVYV